MRPILFSIGHLHFYGYGLMIALGIILAVCVAREEPDDSAWIPPRSSVLELLLL